MDYNTVPTTLPEGKTLEARDADSGLDYFEPNTNYSEKSRRGIGIRAGTYKGQQVVTVGNAWHKDAFEDGSYFHPLFLRGPASLTPDQADALANALKTAAAKARTLEIPVEEPKAEKPKTTSKKGSDLDEIKALFGEAFGAINQRLTQLEQGSGTPASTTATPAASSQPAPAATAPAANTEDPEVAALDPKRRKLYDDLVAGNMPSADALNMVKSAALA